MDDRGYGSMGEPPIDPAELWNHFKQYLQYLWLGLGLVAIVVLVWGSFFQVEPEEKAIVLRFGEPIMEAGTNTPKAFDPGLHFKLPFVDRVYKGAVARQHRLEFGFRSIPGETSQITTRGHEVEALMLTGDLKLVMVRWAVIYVIDDLYVYLFDVKDQEATIRDVVQAVMRQVIGDHSLYEVLTSFQSLNREAQSLIQHHLTKTVPTGVKITKVALENTDVPVGAKRAYDEFNQTEPEVKATLNKAKASLNKEVGQAKKAKLQAIGAAEREAAKTVLNAKGEAIAFLSQLREYRVAPQITKQWMFLKAMGRVLEGMKDKIVIEENAGSGVLKLLPLKDMSAAGLKGGQ